MGGFFDHYVELLSDPAHMAVEGTFVLLVDGLLLGLVWPLVRRALRREHRRIDAEHGVSHDSAGAGWCTACQGTGVVPAGGWAEPGVPLGGFVRCGCAVRA